MHDTVYFEINHIPSVFIASSEFVGAAEAQSKSLGMPDVTRVFVPHPMQDATDVFLDQLEGFLDSTPGDNP